MDRAFSRYRSPPLQTKSTSQSTTTAMYVVPIPGTASILAFGHAISADQKVLVINWKTSITTLQTEAGAPCGGYAGRKPGVQRKDEPSDIEAVACGRKCSGKRLQWA